MSNFLKFPVVPLLLIISFANISIASTIYSSAVQEKLTPSKSKQIREDVQYLLSDKETIDYEDSRLNAILNKYSDRYKLFKVYKDFIEFDKSNVISDSQKNSEIQDKFDSFLRMMSHSAIAQDGLDEALQEDIDSACYNGYRYIKIPLWLVRKYPKIVNGKGFYNLSVNSENSIRKLPEFQNFMDNFSKIHPGYLTPKHGKQEINSYLMTRYFVNVVSFNPSAYIKHYDTAKKSFKDHMLYVEQESYLSIERRLKYERFLASLKKFSSALSRYYQENHGISRYATQTDIILSTYVFDHKGRESMYNKKDSCDPDYYDPTLVNFIIMVGVDNVNYLKPVIKDLGIESKSEILRHAVLANIDIDFIKWLINNGSDPNYPFKQFQYEYPLITSFRNVDVMKLLIESGAKIDASNITGETALFYAIKFNNLEAVRLLINNGANVNAKTNPKIRHIDNADFINTPLIYAKRYASQEIVELLVNHEAEHGPADPQKIDEWIAQGPLDL